MPPAENAGNPELEQDFLNALLSLDKIEAGRIYSEALHRNNAPNFAENIVINVLETIGNGWEEGKYSLSQVYMSGRICEDVVTTLPVQIRIPKTDSPLTAIALLNDHHALGKRMVLSVLHATGYDILDYGRVDVSGLVDNIQRDGVQIILISVLMLPSALHVKDVREKLNAAGRQVKIVVGGAPFRLNKQLWQAVGADAAGYTASDAVEIIHSICRGGDS